MVRMLVLASSTAVGRNLFKRLPADVANLFKVGFTYLWLVFTIEINEFAKYSSYFSPTITAFVFSAVLFSFITVFLFSAATSRAIAGCCLVVTRELVKISMLHQHIGG